MFNPLLPPEAMARILAQYDDVAYTVGNAIGYSKEAASKTNSLSGELYASADGAILLTVPNALVKGVFDALDEHGLSLPLKNGRLYAHIPVMTSSEVTTIGGVGKVSERGHHFSYNIDSLHEAALGNSLEYGKLWYLPVTSPELTQLRKTYGLESAPGKLGFHIVVALRKLGVLGKNEVSKTADALPGGEGDNKKDTQFDSEQLTEGKEHESEHTNSKEIAKEIAKDHLTEDPKYYSKIEKIEKEAYERLVRLLNNM
jgi:hypothetical protein